MRSSLSHLDAFRLPHPEDPNQNLCLGTRHGYFHLPHPNPQFHRRYVARIVVVASSGEDPDPTAPPEIQPPILTGWDHVSAHVRWFDPKAGQRHQRTPFWEEMTWLKDQFFDPTETVLQFHVPKDQHINTHEQVLHLWRPIAQQIPLPPPILV